MNYTVELTPSAQKDLDGFQGALLARFEKSIIGLAENPKSRNSRKLGGSISKWSIRTGDYRILYEIYEQRKVVRVYRIAHRRDVYR